MTTDLSAASASNPAGTGAAIDTTDTIDRVAGLLPDDPRYAMRHRREKIAHHTQLSEAALFDSAIADLSLGERWFAAWLTARRTGIASLAAEYAERMEAHRDDNTHAAKSARDALDAAIPAQGGAAANADAYVSAFDAAVASLSTVRLQAIARHTAMLSDQPLLAAPADIEHLRTAGFTTHAVVVLSQLIAFVSYQARVIAMVNAMGGASNGGFIPTQPSRPLVDGKPYTFDTLGWKAWLDIVPLAQADAEQLKVLEESHPKAKTSDYYLLLVHAPEILRQRSLVFNAIMYGTGGLSRAERELGATVVSRINGCVYCASVHAQRFGQLAKRVDSIEQVYAHPETAGINAREKTIVSFAIALTQAPAALDATSIKALENEGLDAEEILDLTHSIAIFAWANRLMLTLGEPRTADAE